jgi:hypothetical protein
MRNIIHLALITAILIILTGCATQNVPVSVKRAAEMNLRDYPQVAMGDIWGENHEHEWDVVDAFTDELLATDYFDAVLDRHQLGAILLQNSLANLGIIDETTAAQFGSLLGNTAIIAGRITDDNYTEKTSEEPGTRKDDNGVEHKFITNKRSGEYFLELRIKVIDAQTARIIGTKMLYAHRTATTQAEDRKPPVIDVGNLYEDCLRDITKQFIRTIAPYYVTINASYMVDKKYLPELEMARNLLRVGDIQTAISVLSDATLKTDLEPKVRAKAYYDLGLVQVYNRDFEPAKENLMQALLLHPGKGLYMDALDICRYEEENAAELDEQLH